MQHCISEKNEAVAKSSVMSDQPQRPVCLADALGVTRVDDHTYTASMHSHHGHAGHAHGGFCVSQIQHALRQYFNSTHQELNQPDTFNLQVMFLAPVPNSKVVIRIQDAQVGRSLSIVHVRLQYKGKDKIVGYSANTNFSASLGPSFSVPPLLSPPPPPADFDKMVNNKDPHWIRFVFPWSTNSLTKSFMHAERWIPRHATPLQINEFWFRPLPPGQRITSDMLGTFSDLFPRVPENWRPSSPASHTGLLALAYWQHRTGEDLISDVSEVSAEKHSPLDVNPIEWARQALAYPTLGFNLELKKRLPEDGIEWLYCRASTKGVRNGRMEADVTLMDREGDVVAVSNQTAMMLHMGSARDSKKSIIPSSKL